MLARLLDVFFPPGCVGCGRTRWPFCAGCRAQTVLLVPPGCARCGRPLEHRVDRCTDCPPAPLDWTRAAFLYQGPAREALMRLKFSGQRSTVAAMAPWMVWVLARSPPPDTGPEPSVVTWVPLGRVRRRLRGFDQAEKLAGEVAGMWGLRPMGLLRRVRETPPQARRAGAARRRALEGAFEATRSAPPSVLLIDDVLTSGSTAAACAQALKDAGAEHVGLLAAARSLGGPVPSRCYNPPMSQPGSVVARERSSR